MEDIEMQCGICKNNFGHYPESVVLCRHHKTAVHLGCCIDNCSWTKEPCSHCVGIYERL
ncbi:MAG: hypothetical protein QXK37_03115 [Candidatus Woesearchaeota archaeon]